MRVILRGFVLGLLSLLALSSVRAETAASGSLIISGQRDASGASSRDSLKLTVHVELSLAACDAGAVFEDSDEMLRVEIAQRAIGTGHITSEPKVSLEAVRNLRPAISPPLLV